MKKVIVGLFVALAVSGCGDRLIAPEDDCKPSVYNPKYGSAIPEMCEDTTLAPAG